MLRSATKRRASARTLNYPPALRHGVLGLWAVALVGGWVPALVYAAGSPQAGAVTIVRVCSGCHSLKYIDYDDLLQLGLTEAQVDELRGAIPATEPIQRQMSEKTAKESFGVVPPDLSLMAIAREGGAKYIYNLITGFYLTEDGNIQNHAFPGTRMPDIFGISAITEPQAIAQVQQTARNAAAFLHWAADPSAGYRIRLGFWVIGYLILFTVVVYLLKQQIWKQVT